MADYAGDILILHKEKMPGERRLAVDPVDLGEARILQEHGAGIEDTVCHWILSSTSTM